MLERVSSCQYNISCQGINLAALNSRKAAWLMTCLRMVLLYLYN